MTFPRISLARMMILVAVLAVNFAVVHALRDHMEEQLLFLALPTVDLLAAVGLAGFCRRRMRAFALQGQRSLKRCSGKDFQQKVLAPAATPSLHGEAVATGMLLQQ
jgi:MprA protease rhombosortase-interaction domain-containing protein